MSPNCRGPPVSKSNEWNTFCDMLYESTSIFFCYRPQRGCGKVIFSQASVIHSVHRGGGSLSGQGLCQVDPPGTVTSGWYASYWNAFLLKPVYTKRQWLIWVVSVGVNSCSPFLKRVAWCIKKSQQFNQRDIAAWTLTFSVNGSLDCYHRISRDIGINCKLPCIDLGHFEWIVTHGSTACRAHSTYLW